MTKNDNMSELFQVLNNHLNNKEAIYEKKNQKHMTSGMKLNN